jgi:hypothetical protein
MTSNGAEMSDVMLNVKESEKVMKNLRYVLMISIGASLVSIRAGWCSPKISSFSSSHLRDKKGDSKNH